MTFEKLANMVEYLTTKSSENSPIVDILTNFSLSIVVIVIRFAKETCSYFIWSVSADFSFHFLQFLIIFYVPWGKLLRILWHFCKSLIYLGYNYSQNIKKIYWCGKCRLIPRENFFQHFLSLPNKGSVKLSFVLLYFMRIVTYFCLFSKTPTQSWV